MQMQFFTYVLYPIDMYNALGELHVVLLPHLMSYPRKKNKNMYIYKKKWAYIKLRVHATTCHCY